MAADDYTRWMLGTADELARLELYAGAIAERLEHVDGSTARREREQMRVVRHRLRQASFALRDARDLEDRRHGRRAPLEVLP